MFKITHRGAHKRCAPIFFSALLFASSCVSAQSREQQAENDETSYIRVPEVRGAIESRTIEVAYVRFQSPNPGIPTFVILGGPGESITDYPDLSEARAANAQLLHSGDVVIVEQRGIGASRPALNCEPAIPPLDQPLSAKATYSLLHSSVESCASNYRDAGTNLRGYTTLEMVEDIDAIRRALGYTKINITGGSFGATVAYQYIRIHGDNVNRAVLTQMLAPGHTFVLPSTIDEFVLRIGDRLGVGQDWDGADLTSMIATVLDDLDTSPAQIDLGEASLVLGRFDLEIVTALALRQTQAIFSFPALFQGMSQGDFNFVGGIAAQWFRGGIPLNLSELALDCANGASESHMVQFKTELDNSLLGRGAHVPFPDICDSLTHGDVGVDFRKPVHIPTPILVIQGDLDARANVENVRRAFEGSNAQILVVKNATHDLGRSVSSKIGAELANIEARFLSEGEMPTEELVIPIPR